MIKKLSCFIWTKANFRIASHTPGVNSKNVLYQRLPPRLNPLPFYTVLAEKVPFEFTNGTPFTYLV